MLGRMWKQRAAEKGGFDAIVADSIDRLYATALRLTRSEADAEDLVQETLVRAFEALPRFDPQGNLRAYLGRILMNVFINRYRHGQVVAAVSELASGGALDGCLYSADSQKVWSDPVARFDHVHLSAALEQAVRALPERFRVVLLMADVLDFTYAEIAAQLGIPAGTVMSRLFRARHSLRERLGSREAVEGRRKAGRAA
jgi:RNA polymerase sigma-70 factor (ECF subfamily)